MQKKEKAPSIKVLREIKDRLYDLDEYKQQKTIPYLKKLYKILLKLNASENDIDVLKEEKVVQEF